MPIQLAFICYNKIKMSFWEFIKQYSIVGLAIGVAIGGAVNDFVNTLVKGFFRPLVFAVVPWKFENLTFIIRGSVFEIGKVLDAFISFLVIALTIYFIVRYILRKEELLKK
jgi:large conductance mechanosensitive channel